MSRATPPARKLAIPVGLIGMLALIAVIETRLKTLDKLTTKLASMWQWKSYEAGHEARRSDVLCFGDSLIEFGVLPHVLSGRSRRPSYNLALPGGVPSSSYFLLKRSIDAGAQPSAIIVDFMPYQLLPVDELEAARKPLWPYLARTRDIFDLAVRGRDVDLAVGIGMARLLVSCRTRTEIRSSIVAALENKSLVVDETYLLVTRWNLQSNRGAFVVPDVAHDPDPNPSDEHLLSQGRDTHFVDYVDRFLGLAASRDIKVYCLIPPISPEYQTLWDGSVAATQYEEFLREKLRTYPNLVIIDGRHSGYGTSQFLDTKHLSRNGAAVLSDDLALLIAEHDGTDRWVKLPRFRQRRISETIEDVGETLITIGIAPPRGQRR